MKRTPAEWSVIHHLTVMDRDGWNSPFRVPGKLYEPQEWEVPISEVEWTDRMSVSSIIRKAKSTAEDRVHAVFVRWGFRDLFADMDEANKLISEVVEAVNDVDRRV